MFCHICILQRQTVFRYLGQEFLQLRSLKALLWACVIKNIKGIILFFWTPPEKIDCFSFRRKEFLLQVVFAATKAAQATPVLAHYHKRRKDGNPWTIVVSASADYFYYDLSHTYLFCCCSPADTSGCLKTFKEKKKKKKAHHLFGVFSSKKYFPLWPEAASTLQLRNHLPQMKNRF